MVFYFTSYLRGPGSVRCARDAKRKDRIETEDATAAQREHLGLSPMRRAWQNKDRRRLHLSLASFLFPAVITVIFIGI